MFNRFLDYLERRYGRYNGIHNLMTLIVAGMAIVYVADMLLPSLMGMSMSGLLMFNKAAIFRGQIWRTITFVFIPPNSSMFFIVFSLLFYWSLGNMLQTEWGTLRFNVFYIVGMIGTVIAGTITGYATSYYLNMSLFLACALLYPNRELNLYGFLRLRMKWLALVDIVLILMSAVSAGWPERIAMFVSLLNVILFFYGNLVDLLRNSYRRYQWKKNWR